jgi:hypothetical protein
MKIKTPHKKALGLFKVLLIKLTVMATLFAHHGGGGQNHKDKYGESPEIDGSELTLAVLAVACVWLLYSRLKTQVKA